MMPAYSISIMVGVTFPSKLTEEEENFQKKLAKLKKKKRAIAAAKVPKLEKQESIIETPQLSTDVCPADEQAKKLKKLAAIKEALASKEKTFKRTKRRKDSEAKTSVAYHPFSQSENEPQGQTKPSVDSYQKFDHEAPSSPATLSSSSSFVSRNNASDVGDRYTDRQGVPKSGRTLYVHGYGLTESIVRNTFQIFGNICNISFDGNKNCAFVTYANYEVADEASKKVNDTIVDDVMLKISFARKQPSMDSVPPTNPNDATANSSWSSIATSGFQRGSHKDKRSLVSYDDLFGMTD